MSLPEGIRETLAGILDELAVRFGTTGAELWGVLVRQAYLRGLVNAVGGALLFLTFVVVLGLVIRGARRTSDDDEAQFAILAFGGLVSFALGLSSFVALQEAWTRLLNPRYFALKEILRVLGGN